MKIHRLIFCLFVLGFGFEVVKCMHLACDVDLGLDYREGGVSNTQNLQKEHGLLQIALDNALKIAKKNILLIENLSHVSNKSVEVDELSELKNNFRTCVLDLNKIADDAQNRINSFEDVCLFRDDYDNIIKRLTYLDMIIQFLCKFGF
jgi:hypothetical protein